MDLDDKMNYNENCLATFNDLHDDVNCSLDFFSTLDKYSLREDTLTTSTPSLSKTDNREDIDNLVENAFISTSDNSLKSTYSGSAHGSWFDGLSKENEDLKRANKTLKQKITHQNRLIANCEEKLAISMKDLFSTKEELDQLKKKNEENETENSNLKLHIEQLKIEVNQFKNLKLMKDQERLKVPELEEMLASKSKSIERYKKRAVANRALITEKDNLIKRMECHTKYLWDVLIDISGKLGRAGILTEKQKRNLLREYEEEYLSLNISVDEDGKDIKNILNALPTVLFEVPDTSTNCSKKISDLSSNDELRSSSVCSSTPSLSANEVTSSDDFHTDSLRNKLLMHPLMKRAKAKKSLSRKLKSSLPLQEHKNYLISYPSPDTLSSEKEREPYPVEQSKTEINLITQDSENNKNGGLEIIERPLTANYSASLNESDICLQSKSFIKDIPVPLLDISSETAGNVPDSEKIGPIEKNPTVIDIIQQEFNCVKQIHEKSEEETIKKQCIPNVSNDVHKKTGQKEAMLYDNLACDFQKTSTLEKTSNVPENDFYILDDSLEETPDLGKISFDFLSNGLNIADDFEKTSNPEGTNCDLLQNDLNISNGGLDLSDDDILFEFKETLNILNKLPTCISPLPPTPPNIDRLFEVPSPLNNDLEKSTEILHHEHIISPCSNKETMDISDENICSDFNEENTSANLKSPSSKMFDFDYSTETNYSPEEITNNNEILFKRNLPTYSHNGLCSGSDMNDHNIFSETNLNSRNDDSLDLQSKNICSFPKLGCRKSLTCQDSCINTNECKNEDDSDRIELLINKKQISHHNLHTETKENSVSDSSNNISKYVFSSDKPCTSQVIEENQDIFSSEVLKDFSLAIHFKNVQKDLSSDEDDCSKANNCEANLNLNKKLDVKGTSVNKTESEAISAKSHLKVLPVESHSVKKKSKNKFLFHRGNSNISQNQNIQKPNCISESEKDSFIKKISVVGTEKGILDQVEKVSVIKDAEQNTSNVNLKDFDELVKSSIKVESEASSIKKKRPLYSNFIPAAETLEKKHCNKFNDDSNKIIPAETYIKNLFEGSLKQSSEVELQTPPTKRKIPESSSSIIPLKKICKKISNSNSSSKKKTIMLPGPSIPSNSTKSRLINKASLNLTKEEMLPKKCTRECSNPELQKKPCTVKKVGLNVGNSLKKKIKNTSSEFVAPVRIKGRTFQGRTFSKKSGNDDSITSLVVEKQNIDSSKTLEDVKCPTSIVNEVENTEYEVNKMSTKVRKEHQKKNSSINVFSAITTNSNPSDGITLLNPSLMEEKLQPVEEVTLEDPLALLPDDKKKTNLRATKAVLNLVKKQSSFKQKLIKIQEYAAKQNTKCSLNCKEGIAETLQNDKSSKKVTLRQNSVSNVPSETQLPSISGKSILKDFEKTTLVQNKVCSLGEKRKLLRSVKNFQTPRKKSTASIDELVNERKEFCFNNSVEKEKSKMEEDLPQICIGESSIHRVFTINKSKQTLLNKNSNFCTISDDDNCSASVVNSQDYVLPSTSPGTSKSMKCKKRFKKTQELRKKNMHLRDKNKIGVPSPNLIQHILQDIENVHSTDERFKLYVHSLTNHLINPANAPDVKAVIFHVLNYLHFTQSDHLIKFIENRKQCEALHNAENCIVRALLRIEKMAKPYLCDLIQKTLDTTYQLILAKKNFPSEGLASFCRVLTEICKCKGDKSLPLSLCCDLLKAKHKFSPVLVASIIGVWKEPFELSDDFSNEEMALFGAIALGADHFPKKCKGIWKMCYLRFLSENLPAQSIPDITKAVEFVKERIILNCLQNSYNDIWKLASALVILSGRQRWDWIEKNIIEAYILKHLDRFSSQMWNEQAFNFFCDLYVDIALLNPAYRAEKVLIWYFQKEIFNKDDSLIKDSAAIAIIKLSIFEKREMPASVLKWFERNQDNPKLVEIENVFQKRLIYDNSQYLSVQDIVGV